MDRWIALGAVILVLSTSVGAQTPQPFPRPGSSPAPPPAAPAPAPAPPAPAPSAPTPTVQGTGTRTPPPASAATAPDAVTVWFPVYPTAQFLASYDAGRGQRYYIYGTTALFADLVTYYKTQLKERGDLVFEQPPTYMFEVGRFRTESMAFPPGVTIKDWTWAGSQGYPNPKAGAQPARFPTIIMIVPPPAGTATNQR